MADIFQMDAVDILRLRKMFKRAPKEARKAVAFTINGFALGVQRTARDEIKQNFTLRNPKFILNSLRVDLTKPNKSIGNMTSEIGSVRRPRYTGLMEQETGKTPDRNRTFTSAAREGSFSNVTKGWARLKPNAKYPSPGKENLAGLTGTKRIVAFFHILNERAKAQTFILRRKFGRFKRGLYRFKQGKITKLQSFDDKHKPRRIPWLTNGRKKYFSTTNINKVWATNIKRALKKHI